MNLIPFKSEKQFEKHFFYIAYKQFFYIACETRVVLDQVECFFIGHVADLGKLAGRGKPSQHFI